MIKMCKTLPKHVGHKVFADNFFTSIQLIEKLKMVFSAKFQLCSIVMSGKNLHQSWIIQS